LFWAARQGSPTESRRQFFAVRLVVAVPATQLKKQRRRWCLDGKKKFQHVGDSTWPSQNVTTLALCLGGAFASLSKLADIIDATDAARHSNATSQSCQHKRRQNSDDGGDHQQFNQREAISIGPAHIDWTVALLECHEWLSGDVAIENMTRDETSKGVCSPGTRNLCSVGGWSRRSDTSFRLFFQWPTTSLPA
jgi:hypothetical protein